MADIKKVNEWLMSCCINPSDSDSRFDTLPNWGDSRTLEVLNYIVSNCLEDDESYLEIGSFMGGSLCGALRDNKRNAYVIDPLLLNTSKGCIFDCWTETVEVEGVAGRVTLFREKCEDINIESIGKIGLMFYDGNHDSGHNYEALNKFKDVLSDEAIIIVDDYNIHGGAEQETFPGHDTEFFFPVKVDVDRWIAENDNATLITMLPYFNNQAVIAYKKKSQ